ncbi:MAG: hypothetical protein Alis3KO_10640 [Aliiglaciecola sp.]
MGKNVLFVMHKIKAIKTAWLAGLFMFCFPAQGVQSCDQNQLDKAYQEILYFYFQQDFYEALTRFEILNQKCPNSLEKVSNPGVDPLLLKGGISLAYGLEEQAADIFNQLLSQVAEDKTQTQAWFLLGKALFQKQQYSQAQATLSKISLDSAQEYLSDYDKDQWIYLQSQLVSLQSQVDPEQGLNTQYWLSELSDDSIFRQYVLYNQGLAQLQQGQYNQSVQTLEQLATQQTSFFNDLLQGWWSPLQQVDQTEQDALRDRANLTIGYAHLKNQQALKALEAFNRVRLDSLDTDSAILGYGWAAAQREEYQTALSAWQRLQKVPRSNEYVMESYLASAYAFEQAFAPTQAVDNLQRGLNRFARESQFLRASLNTINDDFFTQLAVNEDWSEEIPAHLSSVMLSKEFRNQMAWLSQSLDFSKQLAAWQSRLDTFSLMLDEREQVTLARAEELKQNDLLGRLAELTATRDALQQQLEQSTKSPQILANEQELEWQARLERALANHQNIVAKRAELDQKPLNPKYQQRLKRLQGVMIWNAADNLASRSWQAQKVLNDVNLAITKTTAQQGILVTRLNEPPKYQSQRQRIAQLQNELNAKRDANIAVQRMQLDELNSLFASKLNQQLAQLDNYKLQAQLAIVRLNDKAFRKAQADEQGAQR